MGWLATVQHDEVARTKSGLEQSIRAALSRHDNNVLGTLPHVGIDVAGPEISRLNEEGMKILFSEVATYVKNHPDTITPDRPFVLRVHAGEMYRLPGPGIQDKDAELASERAHLGQQNCDAVLDAADLIRQPHDEGALLGGRLQVRIGHALFLDTKKLRRVDALGIVLEFNPCSNRTTEVDPEMEMKVFFRVVLWNVVQQGEIETESSVAASAGASAPSRRRRRVQFAVSTDGQGVMRTNMDEIIKVAHQRASKRIEQLGGAGTSRSSQTSFSSATLAAVQRLNRPDADPQLKRHVDDELRAIDEPGVLIPAQVTPEIVSKLSDA